MAVNKRNRVGAGLVNAGGAANRVVSNSSAAASGGVRGGSVARPTAKPVISKALGSATTAPRVAATAPRAYSTPALQATLPTVAAPEGSQLTWTDKGWKSTPVNPGVATDPRVLSDKPTVPRPEGPPGIGKEWVWRKGKGWVAAWIGGVDPRGAAYYSAYLPEASRYEQQRAANEAQFVLGSAAQREAALRNLYSSNAGLAARGLFRSGGLGRQRDVLAQQSSGELDQLRRQYGDIAQQQLASDWYLRQLDLFNQAARDYAARNPKSSYLSQFLKG